MIAERKRTMEVTKMFIIVWIVIGLIAGYLARLVLPGREPGPSGIWGSLLAGLVGALVGGFIFGAFGWGGITGLNLWSILVAFVGAVVFLLIWRLIASHGPHGRPA